MMPGIKGLNQHHPFEWHNMLVSLKMMFLMFQNRLRTLSFSPVDTITVMDLCNFANKLLLEGSVHLRKLRE